MNFGCVFVLVDKEATEFKAKRYYCEIKVGKPHPLFHIRFIVTATEKKEGTVGIELRYPSRFVHHTATI